MSRSSPQSGSGDTAPRQTMAIGELSARTGASARMLRYYEQQGLLQPTRAGNGYRRYDAGSVTVVAQIRGLLDAGLPTDTIRTILPCAHGAEPRIDPCPEIVRSLGAELRRLDERIEHLSSSRRALHRYLRTTGSAT